MIGFPGMADMPPGERVDPVRDPGDSDVETLLRLASVLVPAGNPEHIVAQALRHAAERLPAARTASERHRHLQGAVARAARSEPREATSLAGNHPAPLEDELADAGALRRGGSPWDRVVEASLGALPAHQRLAIQLVDAVGLAYEEAAELLGCSAPEVAAVVREARARLRSDVAAGGLAPPPVDPLPASAEGRPRGWVGRSRRWRTARCLHVAEQLQAYLDDEVDRPTARVVTRHLRRCKRCGLEARTYRLIERAVSQGPGVVDREVVAELRRFAATLRPPR